MGEPIPSKAREQAHTRPPGEVKTYKGLTPVECVKQGKHISEAAYMKPMDLTKKDGMFLLENGCTKQDIKRMYSFKHDAALYTRLKVLGLHPWPPAKLEVPQETAVIINTVKSGTVPELTPDELPALIGQLAAGNDSGEKITDPARIAELMSEPDPVPSITWFYGDPRQEKIPTLKVASDGKISVPKIIRAQYCDTRIRIGISSDPVIIVIAGTDNEQKGLTLPQKSAKIRCSMVVLELEKRGVVLPAAYQMAWDDKEQLWAGTLIEP